MGFGLRRQPLETQTFPRSWALGWTMLGRQPLEPTFTLRLLSWTKLGRRFEMLAFALRRLGWTKRGRLKGWCSGRPLFRTQAHAF